MWIFYIDWQQYWKHDWTMNIGVNRNAHGKRTVSTKQPQMKDLTVGLPDFGDVLDWASFQVTALFQPGRLLEWTSFSFFFFGGWGAQLQSIYYLVLYTDLNAAEGN